MDCERPPPYWGPGSSMGKRKYEKRFAIQKRGVLMEGACRSQAKHRWMRGNNRESRKPPVRDLRSRRRWKLEEVGGHSHPPLGAGRWGEGNQLLKED